MNNKPVAYGRYIENAKMWLVVELDADMPEGYIPLYTHPVKEQDESFDRTASHMAGEYVSWTSCVACGQRVTGDSIHTCSPQLKQLTDEEINKLWAESHEDGIAMQQGFTTQQHYFAHLILRKAQE